jgi:hypothetical protein
MERKADPMSENFPINFPAGLNAWVDRALATIRPMHVMPS